MVDRGGLNYPIRVRDEFSKTTALFRAELLASKAAFKDFQKTLKSSTSTAKGVRNQTKELQNQAKAQRNVIKAKRETLQATKPLTAAEASAAKKRARDDAKASKAAKKRKNEAQERNRLNRKQIRTLKELIRAQRVRERTAIALRTAQSGDLRREKARIKASERQAKADRRAAIAKNVEFQATKRNNAVLFREAVIRKRIELIKAQSQAQFIRGDIFGGVETLKRARGLEKSLKGQLNTAQRLLFTFRRLVGVLALFTLARKGVQAFNDLIKSGIAFNDTIISSTLGVAGLIATLGDVRDGIGQSVDAAQELDLALGLAREQIELLRQDSLRTVATFSQLLDTFQVAVGPGLAAGLNLDEVRQLTTSISQAAAALSVPQNQLAEEIRSLLAGTIQARTTRIATALGITNADIRRLKETGKLFEFLDESLAGFAESAERQARQTISGLQALLKGAFEALVGEAAKPLFNELVSLLNDLLDKVLTITDEFGNLKPNPEAVEALSRIFNALRDGVVSIREFATELGFEGLDQVLSSVGAALQGILGAAKALAFTFKIISNLIVFVRDLLGITSEQIGFMAGLAAQLGVSFIILKKTLSLVGISFRSLVKNAIKLGPILRAIATSPLVLVSAGLLAIVKTTELWFESVTGVNLTLGDTIALVSVGLVSAFEDVVSIIALLIANLALLKDSPKKAASGLFRTFTEIGLAIASAVTGSEKLQDALVQSLTDRTGVNRETGLLNDETELERLARENTNAVFDRASAMKKVREEQVASLLAAAEQREIDKKAREDRQGDVFDPNKVVTPGFTPTVSTAGKSVNALSADLLKLTDNLEEARIKFSQGFTPSGFSGTVKSIFDEQELASVLLLKRVEQDILATKKAIQKIIVEEVIGTERLLAINQALSTPVEDRKEALEGLNLTEPEALLISLLRDEILLRDGLVSAQELSFALASSRAAFEAQQTLPVLQEEAALLIAQVAAERAKTSAIVAGAGERELALVDAQSAVDLAEQELAATKKKNLAELDRLLLDTSVVTDPKELENLNAVIDALLIRRDFEEEILELRLKQLEAAQREADLVANGSLTEGLREGFQQFAEEFSSTFNAGIAIARAAVDGLAKFASQAIVDAFDPTKEVDIVERFARLMQQIAQVILQQLIQLAIAKAIIKTATGEEEGKDESSVTGAVKVGAVRISTEATIASIKISTALALAAIKAASGGFSEGGLVTGFAKGGKVPDHYSRHAQGLTRGGKPRHIAASDTIPAWLTPGEFVMNKAATSSFLPMLRSMNGGNMSVVGSSSAEAAGPSTGMASGGLVSDRIASAGSSSEQGAGGGVILPVLVARDGEMDRLTAGGRNAFFAFMRENSGTINPLLDRSAGRS